MGQGNSQSPNIAAEDLPDLHAESPGLALATENEPGLGFNSSSLQFKHLLGTRMDNLGLQTESNNLWPSQVPNIPSGPYGYYGGLDSPNLSHHPLPVRPTPVQVAAGMGFALPSPLHREDSVRGASWTRYSRPSHSLPYASAEHNGGSSDSGRGPSPSESALQLFLPPQPARVPVVICYPQNTYYTISAIFAASVGSHRQVIIWNGRFSVLFLFMLFVSV
jgi:hypothetical protein